MLQIFENILYWIRTHKVISGTIAAISLVVLVASIYTATNIYSGYTKLKNTEVAKANSNPSSLEADSSAYSVASAPAANTYQASDTTSLNSRTSTQSVVANTPASSVSSQSISTVSPTSTTDITPSSSVDQIKPTSPSVIQNAEGLSTYGNDCKKGNLTYNATDGGLIGTMEVANSKNADINDTVNFIKQKNQDFGRGAVAANKVFNISCGSSKNYVYVQDLGDIGWKGTDDYRAVYTMEYEDASNFLPIIQIYGVRGNNAIRIEQNVFDDTSLADFAGNILAKCFTGDAPVECYVNELKTNSNYQQKARSAAIESAKAFGLS